MAKSIFISGVYEHLHLIETIKKWNNKGHFRALGDLVITHETEDKRQQGAMIVRNMLRKKIEGAAFVWVLVGDDTHNHDWIRQEVELANSFRKKIVCIRFPESTGKAPPILNNYPLVSFEPSSIVKACK